MCELLRFANRNQPRKSVFFFTLRTSTSDVICHRIHSKCKLEKHNEEQQQTNCLLRSGLSFSVSANGNCFDNCFWRIFMLFFISTKIPMEAFQQREFRSFHKKAERVQKRVSNDERKLRHVCCDSLCDPLRLSIFLPFNRTLCRRQNLDKHFAHRDEIPF